MTREEFTDNARQISVSLGIQFNIPTTEQMKLIDYVYMYHPSISNVDGIYQIAYLYVVFGMRLILDMRNTAHAMEDYENKERKLRTELYNLKDDRECFVSGLEECTNA